VIPADAISYDVLRALAPEARSYFCIGVQEGHCLANVLIGNPNIESITLCDTWGPVHGGTNRGSHAHIDTMLANMGYKGHVTYHDCDSKSLVLPLGQQWFDLAYIDGDHSYDYALHDMRLVWPHVTKHMVVHDVLFTDVAKALRIFLLDNPAVVSVYTGGTHTAVISR
jgi:hypothetical protein